MSTVKKTELIKTSRKCATKLFNYKDKYALKNDNATIVFGDYGIKDSKSGMINEINDTIANFLTAYEQMNCLVDVKGIAKTDPMDNYNIETGIAIASSRAEIEGLNWSIKSIKETKEIINKLNVLLDKELKSLEKHKITIKERVKKLSE